MNSSILHRNGGAAFLIAAAAGIIAACSPGDTASRDSATKPVATVDTRPCATPADSVLGLATVQFTKYVTPKPHRYLIPVSTDSALPTSAYWGLQTTGATVNVFPRDTAAQKKAKEQLSPKGKMTLLLVNYHGRRTLPDGRVAVSFSGHYMGGDVDGKAVPRVAVIFACHAQGERFTVEPAAATAS
jgi:hypothetical protein